MRCETDAGEAIANIFYPLDPEPDDNDTTHDDEPENTND